MSAVSYAISSGDLELQQPDLPPFLGTSGDLGHADIYEENWLSADHFIDWEVTSYEISPGPVGRTIVIDRLNTLWMEGDLDESGDTQRLNAHAYFTAIRLLQQAANDLGDDFPVGSTSLVSEGGVRITWFHKYRAVELTCPGQTEPAPFIYHEAGEDYDLEERVGSQALSRWLQWLTG